MIGHRLRESMGDRTPAEPAGGGGLPRLKVARLAADEFGVLVSDVGPVDEVIEVAKALADGDLVGIFPEGRITDTGELSPFRSGIQRIVGRTPVPVVPMALRGLWGSFFSRKGGRAMSNPLHLRPFSKVGLVASAAFAPQSATPEALQAEVAGLRGEER